MSDPEQERLVFIQALEIESPPDREAFLRHACGGDAALLGRIDALLRASDGAPAFLPGQPGGSPFPRGWPGPEGPGKQIGRYKLLEQIGEGGFGVVFMAEQLEPVRRRVALKVIKPGMDSRQVIGRFEAERQALALMEHPNIAQVFDAGATESGLPYFVMELVNGVPITKFCEEQQLDLEARLRLFIEVCSAVQHAHQKGVIHRDLKPSNILVTLHGERPVPKVIDFGIAKATREPLTDKTVFTQFQHLMGTPAYMSPEQAALSGQDVDTRSDIYSLGVLLYELLTGGPPFDPKELHSVGFDEMRRTIREREPEKPSTRLFKLRRKNPESPLRTSRKVRQPKIDRELDLIVLKALEKDRDRRYATANGLAADLGRFMNHEPVTAVAPTLAYQLAKFYRRNRKVARTAVAFAALLLAAALVSTGLAIRTHRAEIVAKSQAATAYNVNEFLWKELLKRLTPHSHTNAGITLREAFDLAAGNIGRRLVQQPLAEAAVRFTFGKTQLGLDELDAAETNLLRALALQRAHAPRLDERMADSLFVMGFVRERQGRWEEARVSFEEAVSIRASRLGPDHPDTVVAAVRAMGCRARVLPPADADVLLTQALERVSQAVGPEHYVARAIRMQLGMLRLEEGNADDAIVLFEESHRLAVREEGEFSSDSIWALQQLAAARIRQGRWADAGAALLQQAAAVRITVPRREPEVRRDLQALLTRWEASGGGPEFAGFRERAMAYLPSGTNRPTRTGE
jgi:eukaryotic-like serine/threonine-protein kinase